MHLELLKIHEHAGVRLAIGTTLHIDDDRGQWLIDIGVARRIKTGRVVAAPAAAGPLQQTLPIAIPNSIPQSPTQPDSSEEPTP